MGRDPEARCTRCGRDARAIAWSEAECRYVHWSVTRRLEEGIVAVCGGTVEVPGVHAPRRGDVVPCFPAAAVLAVHLVRLASFANRRNSSWRGEALCGKTYAKSPHWVPAPAVPPGVEVCAQCAEIHARSQAEE